MKPHPLSALLVPLVFVLANPLAAAPITLVDEAAGYRLGAVAQLPAAPQGQAQDCSFGATQSPEAAAVAAKGWQVVGEAMIGPFRAVSFAPGSLNGPSGSCYIDGGNLGLFEAGKLFAIVWSETDRDLSLGSLQQIAPNQLRLLDGSAPELPAADLLLTADGTLSLLPLPESESHCDGKVKLPLAWGDSLGSARPDLLAAGWQPAPTDAPSEAARALIAAGFPEAEECAGSGAQYCSFNFTAPQAEARLRVITAGENTTAQGPSIVDYEVSCGAGGQ